MFVLRNFIRDTDENTVVESMVNDNAKFSEVIAFCGINIDKSLDSTVTSILAKIRARLIYEVLTYESRVMTLKLSIVDTSILQRKR